MKKFYLFLSSMILCGMAFGQSDVYLKINHKLGTSPFQFNTAASNNNNVAFDVDRLQYYVDRITLVHDGGMQTTVPNTWLLVDAGVAVNEMLGNYSITSLESIKFGIGVHSDYNHLDPSSYASSHPLAPQFPSMHWGWSAGYRFVAMEGKGGSSLNQSYEIHALEDINYFTVSVATAGTLNGSDLVIELDADYEMALRDIDVSAGVINHGGTGEAVTLLQNFRDHVFSEASVTTGLENEIGSSDFNIALYPNPVQAGHSFAVQGGFPLGATLIVSDLSGKTISQTVVLNGEMQFQVHSPGFYLVSVSNEGQILGVKKLIVVE